MFDQKEYYKRNQEAYRIRNRRNWFRGTYGLELRDYFEMYMKQGGRCGACDQVPEGKPPTNTLHVDHDHETGKVRSLLCSKCNQALGLLNDSLHGINNLIDYLKPHKAAIGA